MNRMRLIILSITFLVLLIGIIVFMRSGKKESMTNVSENNGDTKVVLYYASWCGWSKKIMPEWEKFENYCKQNMNHINVQKIACENEKQKFCSDQGVEGYPTILIYKNGKKIVYNGERTMETLVKFCKTLA